MWNLALLKLGLIFLLFLNYSHPILAQSPGLISKFKWDNSPADPNAHSNGQSTNKMVHGEKLTVAEEISCWEQNGQWEKLQICPDSQIVNGHKFRYLSRTGLTGIELKCTPKYGQGESLDTLLIDFEGQVEKDLPRGGWGKWRIGNSSSTFAEGFSFTKGEMSLIRSVQNYNMIYHSRNKNKSRPQKQSNSNSGKMYTKCPPDHAICGLTAMMDKARLGIVTAIGLKCCQYCIPEEKWVTIHHFNNTGGWKEEQHFNTTVGLQRTLEKSEDYAEIHHDVVHGGFEARSRNRRSNSTGFDWSDTSYNVWTTESRITGTYICERNRSCAFIQLVGECGSVRVPVTKFCEVSVPVGESLPDSCNLAPSTPGPVPTKSPTDSDTNKNNTSIISPPTAPPPTIIYYVYTITQNHTHHHHHTHNHTHFHIHENPTTTTTTTTTTSTIPPSTTPEPTQEPLDPSKFTSCSHALESLPSPRSARQSIYPFGNANNKVEVLCDFETDGGGWTIIQKRGSGPKHDFDRTWSHYSKGFGSLDKNFWLGLENIHALTKNGDQELRIELEDFEGNKRYAKYSYFLVSDASKFYRLNISGYSGDAGDDMTPATLWGHNRMRFTTKDKDNDKISGANCAVGLGGWWFNWCGSAKLNGLYFEKGETVPDGQGIHWNTWNSYYSLAKTEMKIRKRK